MMYILIIQMMYLLIIQMMYLLIIQMMYLLIIKMNYLLKILKCKYLTFLLWTVPNNIILTDTTTNPATSLGLTLNFLNNQSMTSWVFQLTSLTGLRHMLNYGPWVICLMQNLFQDWILC